jgi:hypothetical protein
MIEYHRILVSEKISPEGEIISDTLAREGVGDYFLTRK